jgi:hypothetical protein
MLTEFFRRRAIQTYFDCLLSRLRSEHGLNDVDGMYTSDQLMETLRRHRFNTRYARYAVAMYCDNNQYDLERAKHGWPDTCAALRAEIDAVILKALKKSRDAAHSSTYVVIGASVSSSCHHAHQGGSSGQGGC